VREVLVSAARMLIQVHETDLLLYPVATPASMREAMVRAFEYAKSRCFAPDDIEVVDTDTGEVLQRRLRIVIGPDVVDRTLKQNRFYWGPVLRQISEQAMANGTRYAPLGWHEAFKRELLGYEVVKVPVAGRKRPQVYRRLRSTTDLSVKQMSEYLDQIIATATTDLGVEFVFDQQERESVRWRRKPRKPTPVRSQVREEEHAKEAA
jgi:hypothetical protein